MSQSPRTSALADRHRALGSDLSDWNGMGTAWSYASSAEDEHDAVREAAGLFDMSPLKKVRLRGADAAAVLDHALTRDVRRIGPGQSAYTTVPTERGTVCDDAIVSNNGGDEWMLVHGSGGSFERLQESAAGRKVDVELDDDLHDISLQGPKALALLGAHTPLDLGALRYFEHAPTTLFGHRCRISRTGYSGERGYEIFASAGVVGDIWDSILEAGAADGVMPCSFTALDKVRIEAGLLFFGYDMTDEHYPWEVGLGFTVARDKSEFRGRQAMLAQRGKERFRAAGIVAEHDAALAGGERLLAGGEDVGVVNSPGWSHRMKQSLALVHLRPDAVAPGTRLDVVRDGFRCAATVAAIPFFDPGKARTHE